MNDLRLAFRLLVKDRGFSTVAVLSLALGIGADTTIFSLLNGLLLAPMPGRDPSRLVDAGPAGSLRSNAASHRRGAWVTPERPSST